MGGGDICQWHTIEPQKQDSLTGDLTDGVIRAGAAVLWAYGALPENMRLQPEDIVGEVYEAMRLAVRHESSMHTTKRR
jgi:hypothetical protein